MSVLTFGLNHMCAPGMTYVELFDLAVGLGISQVEIRNDLAGQAILDGTPAARVGAEAAARGLTIVSINALQRFNDWSAQRADEAKALADYAQGCGAQALVMCPVNDTQWQPPHETRLAKLRQALEGLLPILEQRHRIGLVEPLGFAECSLRLKSEAVAAIDAVGGGARFRLVHDTFHHFVAGESALFAERTGLVHISGVEVAMGAETMRDPQRVLVGAKDRIGNIAQIKALRAAGFNGVFSFEPFAAEVHALPNSAAALKQSMTHILNELHAR